jgi:hypothetical protein
MSPCRIDQLIIIIHGNITTCACLLLQDGQRPENILLDHFDDEV